MPATAVTTSGFASDRSRSIRIVAMQSETMYRNFQYW